MMIDILRQTSQQDVALAKLATRVRDPEQWAEMQDQYLHANPVVVRYRGKEVTSSDPLNAPGASGGQQPAPDGGGNPSIARPKNDPLGLFGGGR